MKYGKSLSELANEIERQANAKRDMIASTGVIRMIADPDDSRGRVALRVGEMPLGINDIAHNQIGNYVGVPSKYYDRMLAEAPELLAQNVNAWLDRKKETRLVRTMDGVARALLSDSYRPLENYDLAEAVLPVLIDLKVEVVSAEITDRRLYIKAVDPSINRDIPKGTKMGDGSHHIFDTCVPAISISNSEVGMGMLSVETGMLTKACTNLAFFAQSGMKRRHLGARHDLASDELMHLLSDETRRVTDQAIWLQIKDVTKAAFDEVRFDAQIEKIKGTVAQKIDADPIKVVEFTAKKFGMSDGERNGVLRHLIEGADLSRYGLFNAVTRTAEDLTSYDRASEFEKLGGVIIDLPRSQWNEIASARGELVAA